MASTLGTSAAALGTSTTFTSMAALESSTLAALASAFAALDTFFFDSAVLPFLASGSALAVSFTGSGTIGMMRAFVASFTGTGCTSAPGNSAETIGSLGAIVGNIVYV